MKTINVLITAFIAVLVGIMLLGTVATQTYTVTGNGILVQNEAVNISNAYNGDSGYCNQTIVFTLAHKGVQCSNGEGRWVSGSVAIYNRSGTVLRSANYTVDYGNNTIIFKNTSTTDPDSAGYSFFGGNMTNITYQYYPNDYLCSGWNRSILNLIPGFFGIAILAAGIAMFYWVAKEEGFAEKI